MFYNPNVYNRLSMYVQHLSTQHEHLKINYWRHTILIVYLSVVYLHVPATVSAKVRSVTNKKNNHLLRQPRSVSLILIRTLLAKYEERLTLAINIYCHLAKCMGNLGCNRCQYSWNHYAYMPITAIFLGCKNVIISRWYILRFYSFFSIKTLIVGTPKHHLKCFLYT